MTKSSTRYAVSPWVDTFPKSRRPSHPKQKGPLKTDVVIVGGGLTGCTTAYLCAAAGVKVVLVEADQIGQGTSGSSIGWIADDPGLAYSDIEKSLGRRAARHTWKSWHRAALDFAALLRRLKVKCDLQQQGGLLIAATPDQLSAMKREQKARHDAGVESVTLNARAIAGELAMTAGSAFKSREGFTLDPYRATVGLAAEAVKRGAVIFERTSARKITFTRKWVDVHTSGGAIRADHVVIATGTPTPLFKALVRHFWLRHAFLVMTEPVPAKIRKQLGKRSSVVRDSATPAHVIRWLNDERLIVSGADGDTPPERVRESTLAKQTIQRAGQLMYELSTMYPDISGLPPAYGWNSAYARSADGLPYFGSHRNYPRHLFAFGDSSPSVTGAYLAARIFLRQVLGESDPADEAFGFNRYGHVR